MIPADSKTLQNGTRPSEMMLSLLYNTTFEKIMIFHQKHDLRKNIKKRLQKEVKKPPKKLIFRVVTID